MIEVEKKLLLKPEEIEELLKGADFIKEVINDDTYFDTKDFELIKKDIWLRKRNREFEIKLPMVDPTEEREIDRYREIEGEEEVKDYLGFKEDLPLERILFQKGYLEVVKIKTARKKYQDGEFTVDVDSTDYGFNVVEVELLVEEEEVDKAADKIMEFISSKGVGGERAKGNIRGKVLEYIYRNYPKEFEGILKAWRGE